MKNRKETKTQRRKTQKRKEKTTTIRNIRMYRNTACKQSYHFLVLPPSGQSAACNY